MVSSSVPFLFLFYFINMLFLYSLLISTLSPINDPLCHSDESSALLQFKETFIIDRQASKGDPLAYPKVESWNLKLHNDCCSWGGVECDKITGHVIGLDLNSSCLYGSINSTSSLFNLVHLRNLNLACNNFNFSKIPSRLGVLLKLTHLNLSNSAFAGQIPSNISQLSKLSLLDLGWNDQLMLKNPNDFKSLVQNLTNLEVLLLAYVDISSTVPDILANFSSLRSIRLGYCGLYGEFPIGIFQLPRLQILRVGGNHNLNGQLPEFNFTSPLQSLILAFTNFSGQIPASLTKLKELVDLDLSYDSNLVVVNSSSFLSWIGMQNKLLFLGLASISLNCEMPVSFANLTQLAHLNLHRCVITGKIPYWLMNMTQLSFLDLAFNYLQGPIPNSIRQLKNLEFLDLSFNNLSGTVKLAMFLEFRKLTTLALSQNNISLLDNVDSNTTMPKFFMLGFGSCKLSHFPHFLRDQDELGRLDLQRNHIHGQIPKWVWNISKDTLEYIDLSSNFLTSFEQDPVVLPWTQVGYLDLSENKFQGLLPIPPPSIQIYKATSNNFTGEISPFICGLNSLFDLELSNNKLSGTLPQCFGDFSSSLQFLGLGSNNFHGKIPQTHTKQCNLKMLILDSNQFEGQVPRSLLNCSKLELLILGNNQINDVFPSWLGALQWLKILILRSNQFHGVLGNHVNNQDFPRLHIIDLSQNNFSGTDQLKYFLNWNAMKIAGTDQSKYLDVAIYVDLPENGPLIETFSYSMLITNKGIKLEYSRILESLVAIDLSCNKFEGDIPEIIGNLIGVRMLNLSNNNLSGSIPSSLGSLTLVESLDLSRNHLSGRIPQQLAQLNFLAVFNVSYNNLAGPIPQGQQFDTFENNSYLNNSRLCGNALSRKCEGLPPSPPISEGHDQDLGSPFEFGWQPVLMGYGSGVIIGVVIGHYVAKWKYEWFLKTFRVRLSRKMKSRMSRN